MSSRFPDPASELHQLVAALCDRTIDPAGTERLAGLLRDDPEAQWFYVCYFHLHASLSWIPPSTASAPQGANGHGTPLAGGLGPASLLAGEAEASLEKPPPPAAKQPPPLPQHRPAPSPTGPPPLPAARRQAPGVRPSPQRKGRLPVRRRIVGAVGGLLGVGLVAVIIVLLLSSGRAAPARLTGAAGCCWLQTGQAPGRGDAIQAGRDLELTAGVAEITFAKGTKVIVEAPAVFQVLSNNAAHLQKGKLLAKVPGQAIGFTVTTPWGEVVDQGTEFAVEADETGRGEAHVFSGKVVLKVASPAQQAQAAAPVKINLAQGEAAGAAPGGEIQRKTAEPQRFLSSLPELFPIFGTGSRLTPGEPDPHWQIVASSTDKSFRPQQAVVVLRPREEYVKGSPEAAQWVSVSADLPGLPTYSFWTFRTTFDLSGFDPATARVEGLAAADSFVDSVRLNGNRLAQLSETRLQFGAKFPFKIDQGFVQGTNTLELVVKSRHPGGPGQHQGPPKPMALYVELHGTAKRN